MTLFVVDFSYIEDLSVVFEGVVVDGVVVVVAPFAPFVAGTTGPIMHNR